ncbi:hypothetical protein HOG17_04275 [Candidatus Peregrinibacteria bacterium]|jgi:hypothetical protein|nr:hypothetical protein [Candidatus Peregrinibacteria bacterium]MBT4366120.1 hypothetical protein [Candidatus Peregrinibacteria bacterium]MBT4456222.1 hypothetical protein [Candidatus Peregrinibacteria bacterium]
MGRGSKYKGPELPFGQPKKAPETVPAVEPVCEEQPSCEDGFDSKTYTLRVDEGLVFLTAPVKLAVLEAVGLDEWPERPLEIVGSKMMIVRDLIRDCFPGFDVVEIDEVDRLVTGDPEAAIIKDPNPEEEQSLGWGVFAAMAQDIYKIIQRVNQIPGIRPERHKIYFKKTSPGNYVFGYRGETIPWRRPDGSFSLKSLQDFVMFIREVEEEKQFNLEVEP